MITAAPIYRITLALKNRESRKKLDFKDLIEDLAGAKDEYNALNSEKHRMILLEPTRKRLYLILKPGNDAAFQKTMLDRFETILKEGFDWQEHCDQDGALLEVIIIQTLATSEYQRQLEQLKNSHEHQRLGDPELENLLVRKRGHITGPRAHRSARGDREAQPTADLDETMQQLENLVGLDEFKQEIRQVAAFIKQLHAEGRQVAAREVFPFHYIITTEGAGVGLTTALTLMTAVYYHLEIISIYGLVEEALDNSPFLNKCFFRGRNFDDNGICAVIGVNHLDKENLQELCEEIIDEYQEQVVVLVLDASEKGALEKLSETLSQAGVPFRNCHLPAYTEPQLVEIFRCLVEPLGCCLDSENEKLLKSTIGNMQEKKVFHGTRSLKDIACRLMIEVKSRTGTNAGPDKNQSEHETIRAFFENLKASEKTEKRAPAKKEPLTELKNLVGLNTVKERVQEILSHFIVEKKKTALGINTGNLCMHMIFAGNPGTGKTTVARIIGQVLKKEGLLKKGELNEVCREDLVGRYVGQTAPKTAAVIEKSLGSVLFIDEAYSLNGNHHYDYGREVLATLVKKMEEHKNELVVIMAGYNDEMEKMIALNPGLTSRVPHQIHFPDYSGEELYSIFEQQLGRDYQVEIEAILKLKELFASAASVCHRQSGNGRFIRNVVERLKMKQGIRLAAIENPSQEELLQIKLSDVLALIKDRDITEALDKMDSKLIGF